MHLQNPTPVLRLVKMDPARVEQIPTSLTRFGSLSNSVDSMQLLYRFISLSLSSEFIQDCNAVCCHDTVFACGDVHYALAINKSINQSITNLKVMTCYVLDSGETSVCTPPRLNS
jgi:hypothetical protein